MTLERWVAVISVLILLVLAGLGWRLGTRARDARRLVGLRLRGERRGYEVSLAS